MFEAFADLSKQLNAGLLPRGGAVLDELFQDLAVFSVARNDQLQPRGGCHGFDQGLKAFVVRQSTDAEQPE